MEHGLDVVALLARKLAHFGCAHRNQRQVRIDGEFLQILRAEAIANIGERRQPQAGLVDPIQANGFVIIHARERRRNFLARRGKCSRQESLNHSPDALRLRIGHLQIDLGKLGLPVRPQVLVAEAAHNLKILVESRNHQDLLE